MRFLFRLVPAFILLTLLAGPATAFEPARIGLSPVAAGLVRLEVVGTWPDTCTPQLLDVSARGNDVRLHATRETAGCRASPTPYAFTSEAAMPAALLPGEGIHRVRLEVEDAQHPEGFLAGFGLVRIRDPIAAPTLETGFWWAEQGGEFDAGPGLGLSVESQSNLVSLSVMGYDARGEATWYFGAGELREGIAHLDLGRFEGGAGPFARYAAPEGIQLEGSVDVEVLTPSRATLWFTRADPVSGAIDLRPLSIVRFSFAREPGETLLGRWVLTGTRPGERTTRWIELVHSETRNAGFILTDAAGLVSLSCDTPAGRPGAAPALCHLQLDDGDAIEFTDVALRRLSGWDEDGQRTIAFRLD